MLVIINPGASRAEAALPAVSSWFSENSDATIVVAKSKKDRKRELEVRGRKAELIVIGGGDGTISKALPQLLKLGKPFAVLPLGTANDFARYYRAANGPRQPKSPSGRKHRIDVGLANGHPYLNVASEGIASRVAARQSKDLKQKWRVLAYRIALLRSVRDLSLSLYSSTSIPRRLGRGGSIR